ncbi:type II toxin-antitoxin system Phd/YefM family antitoxin [Pseudomonas sp. G5001]|nr:type II toxin-antitoxin system Phd/YefM family antitoxin [Pseudomonas sp. Wu6]NWB75257.1 type II toxin-antitoxin system Phd/YefM family antitoxin [Pseudomonas sp. G5001]
MNWDGWLRMLAAFNSVHTFFAMGDFSMQVISATQARLRFRRIMKLLQEGHSLVITKNGKPACKLVPAEVPRHAHGE